MGVGVALEQQRTDVVFFRNGIVGIDHVDAFLTQSDVKYFHLSDELLVFRKEEG